MTSAVAAWTQPTSEATVSDLAPDPRRITEHDPRVARLRALWRSRLTRSVGQLVRELRRLPTHGAGSGDALSHFIHRHVSLLRAAYADGHELGVEDYYRGVSNRGVWTDPTPDERTERQRLAFYAPSVAKLAHEALLAWQADQAARAHASEGSEGSEDSQRRMLADTSSLGQWQDGVGARLTLQADVTWSGLQDGYVAAGASDSVGLYSLLYWLLEPLAQHCEGCLGYAAGSPYNAPGLGGNTLDTVPGGGQTECGAACKCSLSYESPGEVEQPFWDNVFAAWQQEYAAGIAAQQTPVAAPTDTKVNVPPTPPRRAPITVPLEPLEPLSLPAEGGAPLTHDQKGALDLFRATAIAWEEARGSLPPLPALFVGMDSDAANAWLEALPAWTALTTKQQQLLGQVYEALADWTLASAGTDQAQQSQANMMDVASSDPLTFSGGGYNPYRDPHGRFAPGPHAPREEEGGEGGGASGKAAAPGASRGRGGGKGARSNDAAARAAGHTAFEASHAEAVARRAGHGEGVETPTQHGRPIDLMTSHVVSEAANAAGTRDGPREDMRYGETDHWMPRVLREMGTDGHPDLVRESQLPRLLSQGDTELWRGFHDTAHAEEFRSGPVFAAHGVSGSGYYVGHGAEGRDAAEFFMNHEEVRRGAKFTPELAHLTLKADAKVVSYAQLQKEWVSEMMRTGDQIHAAQLRGDGETAARTRAYESLIANTGRFAAMRGYDAVKIDEAGIPEYLIVNRTAVRVLIPGGP